MAQAELTFQEAFQDQADQFSELSDIFAKLSHQGKSTALQMIRQLHSAEQAGLVPTNLSFERPELRS